MEKIEQIYNTLRQRTGDCYTQPHGNSLRGRVSVLEIVFVGQCEMFVCLDFGHFFFSLKDIQKERDE